MTCSARALPDEDRGRNIGKTSARRADKVVMRSSSEGVGPSGASSFARGDRWREMIDDGFDRLIGVEENILRDSEDVIRR